MALFCARSSPRQWSAYALTIALAVVLGAAALVDRRPDAPAAHHHTQHSLVPRFVPAAVTGAPALPRAGWTATADSQETAAGNYAAPNVLDGNASTIWHTRFSGVADPLPHVLTVDMHTTQRVGGLTYLPRPAASPNGRVGQYRVEVSTDGSTWSAPVASGVLVDDAQLATVVFASVAARFVRLTTLTEAGGRGPWTSAAEINLLAGTDPTLSRAGWTASADSQDTSGNYGAGNVLDGNTRTIWHTKFSGGASPLPHQLTVDMHAVNVVSGLAYLGRQDGSRNGDVGGYRVESSVDGATWGTPAATGTFLDNSGAQTVTFAAAVARYVRLTALTEAGGRGPWTNASEINLLGWPDTLTRAGWTVSADSQDTAGGDYAASNAVDGDTNTFWHTKFVGGVAPLPHALTIDMRSSQQVSALTYLPRPPSSPNGRVGRYRVDVSADATAWTTVATGTFADDASPKTVPFAATSARYVRLTASTEAGNRGQWISGAEVNLIGVTGATPASKGRWAPPIGFPLVPVAAALLPGGKVLTWSSYLPDNFGGTGKTVTAILDPATGAVTQRTVSETGHDMFCPGISMLPDGRVLVTGGDDSGNTSIYNPADDTWTAGPRMNVPRGYQSSATLADGRVFTIGGSWSGGTGSKNGEVWSARNGWQLLPGAPVAPMLTNDTGGTYRQDNHAWLFTWSNGMVLQAGPSKAMNWYSMAGAGATTPAGVRGQDNDAMTGDAVMYDAGRILTVGGSPSYQDSPASTTAHVITLDGTSVAARQVAPMANARSFANSVPLPDGKVAVFGGENYAQPFSDNTAVLTPEIWDPATETFTTMASSLVPRTYHSVAVLLPDGRVFTGGGGLCGPGCVGNHFDGEIFTPPNLLNVDGTPADRPVITGAPATAANGATITVSTDRGVTGFAIIRFGTATHGVDTDQRRIALAATAVSGGYSLTIPADAGVAVPGYYLLFALDANGVPSVAKTMRIG
jgi:galactose oxidase